MVRAVIVFQLIARVNGMMVNANFHGIQKNTFADQQVRIEIICIISSRDKRYHDILLFIGKTDEGVRNEGKDCWYPCTNMNMAGQGRCGYCGTGGMCCRKGSRGGGCDGSFGGDGRHACVPFTGTGNLIFTFYVLADTCLKI